MEEITIQFCSPIDVSEPLYEEIDDTLGVYDVSEYINNINFETHSETCQAVHIEVEHIFKNKLVDDMTDILEDYHDCDVVVVEDDETYSVSDECTIKV